MLRLLLAFGTAAIVSAGAACTPALQRGSSIPPGPNQPPPAREPGGRIVQSPSGLGVTSGGTQGYQTMTTPSGGSTIIVPSGGGTSTVIHSGGLIETALSPR